MPRIQKSKYHLIREGGGQMKEGKVRDEVHAFLLLCLHQLDGPPPPPPHTILSAAPSRRKGRRLKSSAPFEVSVRDTGSNRRKKLIRLCPMPSQALFVPPPPTPLLKSFVLNLLHRLYSFHEQKHVKKTNKPPPPCMTV